TMSTNQIARPVIAACIAIASLLSSPLMARDAPQRTFASPEEAVAALVAAVKGGRLNEVVALFGPGGQELADSSDAATGRRNREVFVAAAAEGWRLQDLGPERKELVLGNESWPFPVPLVKG